MERWRAIFCSLCIIMASGVTRAQAPTTTAGAQNSTGQRIGNIISAAVSTAFPAVSSIIKAIWPNGGNNGVKPMEATMALQAAKDKSTTAQRTNSDDLIAVAKNLGVVRVFVTECGFASIQISAMQRILTDRASTAELTEGEKNRLGDLWTPTNKRLDNVTTATVATSVDGMTDNSLKITLTAIRDAVTNNQGIITNQIATGRASDLSQSLADLAPKLNGIMPLTGILIGDMSSSIATAANNVSSHAGSDLTDPNAADNRKNNMQSLADIFGVKSQ